MSRKISYVIAAVTVVSLALGIAACGGEGTKSAGTPETTRQQNASQQQTSSAKAGVTGTVTGIILPDHLEKVQPLIDKVAAENKGLEFEFETVEFAQLDNKINLAHSSGQGYDFILVNHVTLPQFVGANVLAPLDEYIQKSGIAVKENYNNSAVSLTTVNGKQYAMPWNPDCRVLAYNKKVLADAGLQPPKNFDELLDIAAKVTKNGTYAIGRDVKNVWAPVYDFGSFMLGMNAHIYVKDGDRFKTACNTPEMIDYVKWSQEISKYMPKDVNIDGSQLDQMFIQNKLAFTITGPWIFSSDIGKAMKLGEDYDLMLVPGKAKSGSAMGGWMLGIGSSGKGKDGAWVLLSAILEPENMAQTVNALPADSRAFQFAPFNDSKYKIFDEQMKTAELPQYPVPTLSKIVETFTNYYNQAVIGGMDAAAAMEKADAEIQKILDEE